MTDPKRGQPGHPGEDAVGPVGGRGGAGGEGGAGGAGDPQGSGGHGGLGGAGGEGARGIQGPQGQQGERGPSARWLRWTLVAWMVVFTLLVAYSLQIQRNEVRRNAQRTQQTDAVLCAYRNDLQDRIRSNQVLLAHPSNFGITAAAVIVIRTATVAEQATVDSLAGLRCR